jgi:hypothetical protein
MSLREFAAHLGVSDRMVSKWEAAADRIHPRPVNQEALDTSLARSSDEVQARFTLLLGKVPGPVLRTVDPGAALGASALGTDLWDLHEVLEPRRATQASLALAEQACARLDACYAELPPPVLLPELRRQLNHVVGWMQEPQPVSYRRRLCSLAAHLSGLRAWLYFDMTEYDAADAWFAISQTAAREGGAHDLCGWALGGQSLLPVERQDYAGAAVLLDQARAVASHGGNPTTRTWLDALHGRALAGLGDERGFMTATERARNGVGESSPEDRHHGMDFAGRRLDVSYYEGLGQLLIRQPGAAGSAFTTALRHLPESRVKARAMLMLSVAVAAAQAQDLDRAAP